MSIAYPNPMTAADYDRLAWEYYQTLPLEHFMESSPHATQREIALASLAILKMRRPEVHYFNELLVQYRYGDDQDVHRVVPDNMIVIGAADNPSRSNYAVPLEPAPPFMMLEWVSSSNEGKDYEDSFRKYEQELETPYCILFHPERRDLQVYHHEDGRYVQMEPDSRGRVQVPELDLEIGLKDGWVRFWHRRELLEIPKELSERLKRLSRKSAKQARTISKQSKELGQLKDQVDGFLSWLRELARQKATKANRRDILDRLANADQAQLQQWISELE
jgi:Uma2 family endonuclease